MDGRSGASGLSESSKGSSMLGQVVGGYFKSKKIITKNRNNSCRRTSSSSIFNTKAKLTSKTSH